MTDENRNLNEIDTDLPFTDNEPEPVLIELSPALKNYANIADDAEQSKTEEPEKKDVGKAEKVALGVLSAVEWTVDKWLGANTGLEENDRKEWAAAVAPALVKMGVTDYTGFLDRYSVYIAAIVATYKLGDKITKNVLQQLAEDAAKAEEVQRQAEQPPVQQVIVTQPGENETTLPGLDGYDRDLATQGKLMAGG